MTVSTQTILKRFDAPDEIREFPKGKFEIVHVGGMTIGRATYQPGWKWSEDVGSGLGRRFLHGRTCGHGRFRLRHCGDERR